MRTLLVPLVGAFASGFAPSLVAAAIPLMAVGEMGRGLFVSAAMFAMVLSSAAGGFLADRLGRVRAMQLSGACALVAVPLVCAPGDVFSLAIAGRFVLGFGLGLFSVLLPLYLAETLPVERRGRASALYQFANSLGGVTGAGVGFAVALGDMSSAFAWRIDVLALAPVLILFLFGTLMLERGADGRDVDRQHDGCASGRASSQDRGFCLKRPLLVACALLALTSATGIGVVMHYSVAILRSAGLSGASANGADIMMRIAALVAPLAALPFIERRGRRFVLCVGLVGVALSLVAVPIFMLLSCARLVACSLCVLVGFFSFGPGACVWLLAAEILPAPIRARGVSFAMLGNQVVTALASFAFPLLMSASPALPFALFACGAAACGILARALPEMERPLLRKAGRARGLDLAERGRWAGTRGRS